VSGTTDPKKARTDHEGAGEAAEVRYCETCTWARPLEKQFVCLVAPPVVHIVLAKASPLDQAPSQLPASTRPSVQPKDVCAQHRFPDEMSEAEMVASELAQIARWLREGVGGKQGG
jgi:hypothetical protein